MPITLHVSALTNFSSGWVAYAVTAVVSVIGENKLMPLPDCACKVINGKSGCIRDNTSWIIGRIVRDFESWMDDGRPDRPVKTKLENMIKSRWDYEVANANNKQDGSGSHVKKPMQASLCVSVYKAGPAKKGNPGYDSVYYIGFATTIFQLGIAAIPAGVFGDWSIFLVTIAGIFLSFATGALPQWSKEKWACREDSSQNFVLTRGNGSQHAIIILGDGKGPDLEDLAAGQTNVDTAAGWFTRLSVTTLATLWILLLITAAGIKQNTWFLLAIGGVGILQNIFVAGWKRTPAAYGIPLTLVEIVGEDKVMDTLFAVEEKYPFVGASMVATFFPGKLRGNEETRWTDYARNAKDREKAKMAAQSSTNGTTNGP